MICATSRNMDGSMAFSVYASPVAGSTFFSAMLALRGC